MAAVYYVISSSCLGGAMRLSKYHPSSISLPPCLLHLLFYGCCAIIRSCFDVIIHIMFDGMMC